MAGHGARLPSSVNGQSNDPGFVLPLSSQPLNGWRSFLTSLTPFVSRTSQRRLRVYAQRLVTDNGNPNWNLPTTISPVGDRHERHNILGVWPSSPETHLGRRHESNSAANVENFISVPLHENDNVVINIESNTSRRQSPSNFSNEATTSLSQVSTDQFDNGTTTSISLNSADPENPQENPAQQVGNEQLLGNSEESITDLLNRHTEVKNLLAIVWQYFIFVMIVVVKLVYDKFTSLLTIALFFVGFILSNKITKLAVAHQERRSKRLTLALLGILIFIPLCIYLYYHNASTNLYYSAMLLPSDSNFLSLGELLWIVIITDLVLKLSSVFVKGIIAILPSILIHYKYRGKHFAMIEFTSQLYRSLAPVQPWISYLLDNYTGIQKVFGVFLSAMYMLCKGPDIIYRVKNFHCELKKFLRNSKYGRVPSKSQLKETGTLCPICQDDFVIPTMLQCKHIFCEDCVEQWFDRERTCPMCRTKIADDPTYRDGSTSFAIQLY